MDDVSGFWELCGLATVRQSLVTQCLSWCTMFTGILSFLLSGATNFKIRNTDNVYGAFDLHILGSQVLFCLRCKDRFGALRHLCLLYHDA